MGQSSSSSARLHCSRVFSCVCSTSTTSHPQQVPKQGYRESSSMQLPSTFGSDFFFLEGSVDLACLMLQTLPAWTSSDKQSLFRVGKHQGGWQEGWADRRSTQVLSCTNCCCSDKQENYAQWTFPTYSKSKSFILFSAAMKTQCKCTKSPQSLLTGVPSSQTHVWRLSSSSNAKHCTFWVHFSVFASLCKSTCCRFIGQLA